MMKPHPNVESFRRLIEEWLPGKLAELVDLVEYEVQAAAEGRCGIRMRIGDRNGVVTVQYEDWWCNVRPSNTEPLLRLNLEAADEALMDQKIDRLKGLLGDPVAH